MGGPKRVGAVAALGLALTPLAAARPVAPAATSAGPLVLAKADTPGLKAARASAPAALKAIAAALRPAHPPNPRGPAQASHFTRAGGDLWSLAAVLKSRGAAKAQTRAFVAAARRGKLRPTRVHVGEQGWLVAARGAAVVVWRRQQAVGEILLAGRLKPPQLARTTGRYAALADAHMARELGLDAWERTLARIPAGRKIPKSLALDLFALAYGPLPGTSKPAGSTGPVEDGTLAAGAVIANWSALTADQQAAAAHALGIGTVQPAARRPAGAGRARYTDPHDSTFVEQPVMEDLANKYIAEYTKRTGVQLTTLTVVVGTSETGTDYGEAMPLDDNGDPTIAAHYCRIRIEPAGQKLPIPELRNVIAHEVFHCFQMQIVGPMKLLALCATRPWVVEGTATWAAWQLVPLAWSSVKNWMPDYVSSTGRVLFARSYDAVGFWGHAEEETGDLWTRVQSILLAKDNEAVYAAAGGNVSQFLETWGSSTFVDTKLGPSWTFTRPVSPDSGFAGASVPIVGDDSLFTGEHAFQRYTLDIGAMQQFDPQGTLLHAVKHKGYARLANVDFDLTYVTDDWFWLGPGGPKCPEGKEGQPPPATSLTSDPDLALTGGANGAAISLKLVSLSDYCKEKQPPPKQPSGGGGGGGGGGGCDSCGGSNGDPHLHTFDGVFYDFQGAGEYTLARSRTGDVEVQARSQPFPGLPDVSVDTAFAMRLGGSRVEVDRGDPPAVRVNGLGLFVGAKPRPLPGGGRIRLVSRQVEVTWPDGSFARVWSVGSWGVALLMKPAPGRRGKLAGLLGNFDLNPDNDLTTRSGHTLDPIATPKSVRLLHRVLGESWRITQRQSLFTYSRGQSTRTFTIRSFPHGIAAVTTIPVRFRATALRFCRRMHIKNPQVFQACLLDVGLTGVGAFATSAGQFERTAGGFAKPGRAVAPKKPAKPKKQAKPAKPAAGKGAASWTRLPGTAAGPISVALAGGKVVIAYSSGPGSAEADTFTASTAKDATGAARTTLTSGWSSLGSPVLLERAGGGLQALLTGIHGGNGDPLNGVSFAPRNPDGGWGAPVPATQSTFAEFVTGAAVLAPDGPPLWVSARGGTLYVWRGATGSMGTDLSSLAGGAVDAASVGRDRSGRYWIVWDTAFSSQPSRVGLYLLQFDPVTLQPIGTPQQPPGSGTHSYSNITLPCAASCRVVYTQAHKLGGARIVSWAAGEKAPTTVAEYGVGHGIGEPAAAYTPSGRLWIAWWDNTGKANFGFRAVRGDAKGARGTPLTLSRPGNSTNFAVSVSASGENLVALTVGEGARPFVNVVAP